ncbi:hypothetical protein GF406_18665 [candidate division KSB1 bacterium]|nr:hypothetical protein [candidate division KSB1 bacterium]
MSRRFARLICLWILILPAPLFCQIILSEIMFNPAGNERHNEFIELYNQGSDSVDLCGWQLSDGDKTCSIIDAGNDCLLAPKQYAIVLLPEYAKHSTQYEHLIPKYCLRLTIDQAAFGKNGLANSRNETVALLSPDSLMLSNITYQTPNTNGYSEEKILLTAPDSPENWGNSSEFNGTPGFKNSISPPLDSLSFELLTENLRLNTLDSLGLVLTNRGTNRIEHLNIQLSMARKLESPPNETDIKLDTLLHVNLQFNDTVRIFCPFTPQKIGEHYLTVLLTANQNQYESTTPVYIALYPHALTINEIFISDELMWVELLNSVHDSLTCSNIKLFTEEQIYDLGDLTLPPGYSVIATDSIDFSPWETRVQICKEISGSTGPKSTFVIRDQNVIVDSIYIPMSCPFTSVEKLTNWQCSSHPLGSTPGNINCSSDKFSDLIFSPKTGPCVQTGTRSDTSTISVSAKNLGNMPVRLCAVDLYISGKEKKYSRKVNALVDAKDSIRIEMNIELEPGEYRAILHCITQDETYPHNNRMILPVIKKFPQQSLILNEIMPFTETADQEWIELYNPSGYIINLFDWQICDARRCVQISDSSANIKPNSYWVLSNAPISNMDSCLTVLNIPELNNSGDNIVLKDPFGTCIDTLSYNSDWLGPRHYSLERIRWQSPSVDSINWTVSRDSLGTPGRYNGNSPKDWDLACIDPLEYIPNNPTMGDVVEINSIITNTGLYPTSRSSLHIYAIPIWEPLRTIPLDKKTIPALAPGKETIVSTRWQNVPGGIYYITAEIYDDRDQRSENNVLMDRLRIGYPVGAVVINEVMNNPARDEQEWFELYNPHDKDVLLTEWSFCDSDTMIKYTFSDSVFILPAQSFCIIADKPFEAQDQSAQIITEKIPALNQIDSLVIFDATKRQIDMAVFDSEIRGYSLERISPTISGSDSTNWTICTLEKGHTALEQNSVFIPPPAIQTSLQISPNPFSPDGDGYQDHSIISIELPATTSRANVNIFDIKGRFIRRLVNNKVVGCQSKFIWDGRNESGQECRMGIYIVLLQAIDERKATIMQTKATLVLARPL